MSCFDFKKIVQINNFEYKKIKKLKRSKKNDNTKSFEDFVEEEIFTNSAQLERDKNFILNDYRYRFFDPDFYYDKDNLKILTDDLNNEFKFFENDIFKIKREKPKYNNIKFIFKVVWTESRDFFLNKNIACQSSNLSVFREKFEKFFFDKPFNLISFDLLNVQSTIKLQDYSYFSFDYHFDLSFLIKFNYEIFHNEIIDITIENCKDANTHIKKFILNLPCKNYVNLWNSNSFYSVDDIIFYKMNDENGFYYKCIKENDDRDFDIKKWEKIDFIDFSFSSCSSFLNTSMGKKNHELLNKSISTVISNYLGKKIILYFFHDAKKRLNINDFFIYEEKKYRIIKIQTTINEKKSYIKVIGLEIIKIKKDIFSNLNFLSLEQNYVPQINNNDLKLVVQYKKLIKETQKADIYINLKDNYE